MQACSCGLKMLFTNHWRSVSVKRQHFSALLLFLLFGMDFTLLTMLVKCYIFRLYLLGNLTTSQQMGLQMVSSLTKISRFPNSKNSSFYHRKQLFGIYRYVLGDFKLGWCSSFPCRCVLLGHDSPHCFLRTKFRACATACKKITKGMILWSLCICSW